MKNNKERRIICTTQILLCKMFPTPTMVADSEGFAVPLLSHWEAERDEADRLIKLESKTQDDEL